jgi:hypothetical protein
MCKRPQKNGIPFNFREFQSEEEVHYKKYKKINFDVWTLLSHGFHGMMGYDILNLMFNKENQRYYNCFFKFSYSNFWRKWLGDNQSF